MKKWSYTILILWMMGSGMCALAQHKYEYERRVAESSVPQPALDFITDLRLETRVKWFREIRLKGYSYEAKYSLDKHYYSVEFDSLGQLEDVEIEWEETEIPRGALANMHQYWQQNYAKYRVRKIQIQYSRDAKAIHQFLRTGEFDDQIVVRYEVVAKGWGTGGPGWYEFTFSEYGVWIKTDEIIEKNVDHLVY
ncbi:MAG: hypothetical protein AAFV07_15835 [Bacteroidota bacterium]